MTNDDKQLDDVIQMVRQTIVPPYPSEHLQLELPANPAHTTKKHEWSRQIMRYRLPAATAATIAIVCLAALWNWGPLGGQKSFALQQVGAAIAQVRTVRYKLTTTGWKGKPWPDPYVRTVYAIEPGRTRVEVEGDIQVTDTQTGRHTWLHGKERKVVIRPIYPVVVELREPLDFTQRLRTAAAEADEKVEVTQPDGRKVIEFRWRYAGEQFLVAADPLTMLPVRMEIFQGKVGDKEIREVYSDFVYDEPIDDSLFKVNVPEGFTVEQWKPDPNNKSYPKQDAEQLVISPANFGPVKAGMTEGEIVRLLGPPDWTTRSKAILPAASPAAPRVYSDKETATLHYYSRGFSLTLTPSGEMSVSCLSQAGTGALVRDFAGRTVEGIRIGDSRQKVLDTYGKPELDRPDYLLYMELGWEFSFRDNRVARITASKPRLLNEPGGIQRRVTKDGHIIQAAPGVDIDAMLDEEGNLKEKGEPQWKREPATDSATKSQSPAPHP